MFEEKTGAKGISIHALREEGDASKPDDAQTSLFISIHALREEGDCHVVHRV